MGGHDAVGSGHQGGRRPVSADGLAAALDGLNLTYRDRGRHVLVTHPTLAGASVWDVDLDKGTVADVDAPAVDVIRSASAPTARSTRRRWSPYWTAPAPNSAWTRGR